MKYIYVPFRGDTGLEGMANRGKGFSVILHGDVKTPLKCVDPEDAVYVTAHCCEGSLSIESSTLSNGSRKTLTALQLVNQMKKDGLPKKLRELNLYCCGSGSDKKISGLTKMFRFLNLAGCGSKSGKKNFAHKAAKQFQKAGSILVGCTDT
eukprot:104887_1